MFYIFSGTQFLRGFALALTPILAVFGTQVSAQELTISAPEFSHEAFIESDWAQDSRDSETAFTPYSNQQYEPLLRRGLQFQEEGEHEAALDLLNQVWQISRINYGLYHEDQIPVLKSIVYSELETQDWEAVDKVFDYMTHLYKQLYEDTDPRLEAGLRQISSFHINAFNANLDGEGKYHLQKAAVLLEMRLENAELTLPEDDPKMQYLEESVALSRQHLYLMSDRYQQTLARQGEANREMLFADLD